MPRVRIRAPLHPTEDPARVRRAILNLFPEAALETREREVVGETTSLERLAELVRNHQIPDTARGAMVKGRSGARTRFRLGKQAAYVEHPNFGASGERTGPLGDIDVEIEEESEESLMRLVYGTAPDTKVPPELATVPPSLRPEFPDA